MNNPFFNANDPTHASSRFPDISGGSPSPPQQQQWGNMGSYQQQQAGYGPQFQQQSQQQYGQQGYGGGYLSPTGSTMQSQYGGGSQFQPNQSFGQQGGPVMSGTSYSYLSGQQSGMQQQMQQQQPQLGPAQQQIANNPGYVAQFDPYGPLGSWDGSSGQAQQQQQQQYQQQRQYQQQQGYQNGYDTSQYLIPPTGPTPGVSPNGDPHPKEFIRTNKAALDRWDPTAWRQLLNTFEALKNAWGSRKTACSTQLESLKSQLNFAGYYQQQVQGEIQRVQELVKDADQKFDSVAASTFQMQEVFQGYRQSPDVSSKALVREATNASLSGLPDWPPSSI